MRNRLLGLAAIAAIAVVPGIAAAQSSVEDLDRARAELKQLEAALEHAKAKIHDAEARLKKEEAANRKKAGDGLKDIGRTMKDFAEQRKGPGFGDRPGGFPGSGFGRGSGFGTRDRGEGLNERQRQEVIDIVHKLFEEQNRKSDKGKGAEFGPKFPGKGFGPGFGGPKMEPKKAPEPKKHVDSKPSKKPFETEKKSPGDVYQRLDKIEKQLDEITRHLRDRGR